MYNASDIGVKMLVLSLGIKDKYVLLHYQNVRNEI